MRQPRPRARATPPRTSLRSLPYYVTTPIYYVNAQPHLGHAYTTIAADVLARHMRQRGEDVFFLTGTDEHGEPVALAAEAAGVTPRELADRNSARFEALMPQIESSNDYFIRTSDPRHVEAVQEIMQRVHDAGYIYKGSYEGLYCPSCADFKTGQEVGPGDTCPVHGIDLIHEKEENWFFKLSAFQEPLEKLFADNPDFVRPPERRNEALSFIRSGLRDISCSRAGLSWGVEVPWDPEQVFYVWFDALLNYVTALRFAREGEDLTDRYWPANVQLVGKDILKFHAVFWPAILMAAGLEVERSLVVHGYLLMDGEKMSKSLGNVLDPFEVIERFGADALRFYLLREVQFGADGSVGTAGFESRYSSELANDYGNLASRTIAMIGRWRDGTVAAVDHDPELVKDFEGIDVQVAELLDRVEPTQALEAIWVRVRRLNRFVEEQAPWQIAKEPERSAELDVVLASLAEGLRSVTVALHSFMPDSTTKVLAKLGTPETDWQAAAYKPSGDGMQVTPIEPLFPKP